MRRASLRCLLAALLFGLAPMPRARADPRPFEAGLALGAGGFAGPGWSANRSGGSLLASAGSRLHPYVSLHGMFVLQSFYLREPEDRGPQGAFSALTLAPHVYPLAARFVVEPYLSPMVGYSYT